MAGVPQAARDHDDHRAPNHQPALVTNEHPTTQVEQLKMQHTDLHVQLRDKEKGLADAQKKLRAAVGWHEMCIGKWYLWQTQSANYTTTNVYGALWTSWLRWSGRARRSW